MYAVPQASCTATGVAGATQLNDAATVTNWPVDRQPALVGDNSPAGRRATATSTVDPATSSEWLCFRVDFPLGAGNEYQDAGGHARPRRSTPSRRQQPLSLMTSWSERADETLRWSTDARRA